MLPSPQLSSHSVRAGVSALSLWTIFISPGTVRGLLPSLRLLCTFPARVAAGWEQRWCLGRSCPHPRLSRASTPEHENCASPSISSARSLRMAARISLRSSYSPAARSCKREGPKKEAGSAPAQVPSQQTVYPGTWSLTSFVSSSTLVMASSCSDKAARAACCSSSRRWDLSRVRVVAIWELSWALAKSPCGQLADPGNGPHQAPSCSVPGCSHPHVHSNLSQPRWGQVLQPPSPRAEAGNDPSSQQDSLRPVLLVVLSVAAAFWAEALGCQRLLIPLQLLPLQLPDSRADAAPLSQVQCGLQLCAQDRAQHCLWPLSLRLSPGAALCHTTTSCPRSGQRRCLCGTHMPSACCSALPGPVGRGQAPLGAGC